MWKVSESGDDSIFADTTGRPILQSMESGTIAIKENEIYEK